MRKLLFINGHLNAGGVEKSLLDILCKLDYSKYSVDILLLEDKGDYIGELPSYVNVIFKDLHNTYGNILKSIVRCVQQRDWMCLQLRLLFALKKLFGIHVWKNVATIILGKHEYDVVIGFRPGISSALAAHSVNAKRRITWWHHGEFNVDPVEYNQICNKVDKVSVVSKNCKKMLIENCPTIKGKLVYIPNMLDIEKILLKSKAKNPYNVSRKKILLSVGRLSPEKHFENVISVATCLIQHGITDFQWHIVGEGSEHNKIQHAIEKNNLSAFVFLQGNQVNPYPFMKYADLYVHPSYIESQGLTILEAMTLGLPCVVTKSKGPCEFIQSEDNGLLVEQSPDALADGVLRMLNDRELYKKIKANTCCPAEFYPNRVMKKINQLLER